MIKARIDTNHAEIVRALRSYGCGVQSLAAVGKGCPDLLVSYRGQWHVLEVKARKGLLRAAQFVWASRHQAPVCIVRTVDDALGACGMSRRR